MNLKDKLDRYAPLSGARENRPVRRSGATSAKCEHLLEVFPPHHVHGVHRVDSLGGRFESVAKILVRCPVDGTLDFERIAFVDTETTGLSGGIGVCAFLVGVGYLSPAGFVVEQFLMNDFPAEPDMLHRVCDTLEGFDVIGSYNGRSFDVPILDGRLLLNGIRKRLSDKPHLDLLHPARRLWKHRLSDCSLKSLEAHMVGHIREDDIEGWMIPEAYFKYLRTGARETMEQILHHNRQDILSLACLAHLTFRAIDSPKEAPLEHGLDWYGLGTLLEQHRRMNEAVHCFERAIEMGLPEETRRRCLMTLSLTHKRRGDWNDAVRLWKETLSTNGEANTYFGLEELAKFYEHKRCDLISARDVCQRAIARIEIRAALSETNAVRRLENFEHRLKRIEKKIRNGGENG